VRGDTYFETGDYDKAIADLTEALRLTPGDPNAIFTFNERGDAWLQKGDYDKVIGNSNEGLQSRPDDVDALDLRAAAYSLQGLYEKAVADFDHAEASSANYPNGLRARAWFYATCPKAELRDGAKAVELAKKALEFAALKQSCFIDTLAAAEAETGKWDDAIKHEKQAIETGKTAKENDKIMQQYTARLALYEQKKPYRDEKK
jgi:tetratricopeptide (TPR) repeat protein